MNTFSFVWAGATHKPLRSILSLAAIALGIAMLTALFLISGGIADGLKRNSGGIDIVAGAKGSPLQLILSTVYQSDIPIGNISTDEFESIRKNPMVRSAIPLVMGDNFKGARIIGTTSDYLKLYGGTLSEGRLFLHEGDVVAGSSTPVGLGEEFAARHGFAADSDDIHEDEKLTVVGKMAPTGTILDRLLLTPIDSVQHAHAHHHEDGNEDEHESAHETDANHQITAILIKAQNGPALMNLPRLLNQSSHIQAANPAFEMTKLAKNLGVGRDILTLLGTAILVLSALMLFSTLASSLSERRYDMAVLRILGASPARLFSLLATEGLLIALCGTLVGLVLGHGIAYGLTGVLGSFEGLVLPAQFLRPQFSDAALLGTGLGIGVLALFPVAVSAAKTDILRLLVKG